MKYQSFIMRVLCLLLIVGVVLGYNSMQKKDSDTEKDQQIASLTTRVEALEKQQDEILSALEEAAKAQEEAKKKAEEEAKNQKAQVEETSSGDASEDAKKDEENTDETEAEDTSSNEDSEELVYKNGTYTGDGQGFGGNIQVQVTLENDTITDIQVVSAPGEDSAYLSQGQGVISTILASQSTDVDTISGATHQAISWNSFLDVTAVLLVVTCLFGRHFCGYACAFGSLGDALYELTVFIRQKVFHKKGRHGYSEKAIRILQKVKYIWLLVLLVSILTGWYSKLQGMSPWDVFSMLTAGRLPGAAYKVGIVLLILLMIGMCTQERFFCQFLCPMGAIFAIMPIAPSALFNRDSGTCPAKCGACKKRCPAHLDIDGDTPLSGECICCHACQGICPKRNIRIGIPKAKDESLF